MDAWALEPEKFISQYKLDGWQAERGLEQNSIYTILQTHEGYIWLGTLDGLVRFDGIHFNVFDKQNTGGLKGNQIRSLFEDRNRVLWIGTDGGLSRMMDGQFTPCPVKGDRLFNDITAICEDKRGTLWIASKVNGLSIIEGNTLVPFSPVERKESIQVYSILTDKKGNVWFGLLSGVTKRTTTGEFIVYGEKSGLTCKYVYAICERDNGQLWLGSEKGLYLYQEQNQTFIHYGLEAGLPNIQVLCLYEDRGHCLWGGTDGGGVFRFKEGRMETLSIGDGLACGFVYSIREDREGSLWLGTLEGGLHRLGDTKFTTFTTREGLLGEDIRSLDSAPDGGIFIRTQSGINHLNRNIFSYTRATGNGPYSSLEVDRTGGLWFDVKQGLRRLKNGLEQLFIPTDGFINTTITELTEDRTGAVWIGTTTGLWRYNNGKFAPVSQNDGSFFPAISRLYLDDEDSLWLGTANGAIFKRAHATFSQHSPMETLVNNNSIDCIYKDKEGVLYVGSRLGLHRLANGKFTHFSTHNGMVDNFVSNIFEDDRGNIWMGGRTGIFYVEKKELAAVATGKSTRIHPQTYNEEDGMKSRWCQSRGTKSHDGKLWFPTTKGVVVVDPANLKKNNLPPPVIIEELIVDGENSLAKGRLAYVKNGKPLVIPPGKKRLEFFYTALSFINSKKIKFKLKLEGYDNDWIDVGNTRKNTYTALPPGHYTLRVTACNSDGVWNTQGAFFPFYMKPYYYQTTWFYVLIAFISALLFFSLYRYRVGQLQAREKELSRLVDIRTQSLHERTMQLEIAHHDLRLSHQIIQEKNQHILSSIQYARKIQQAILPTDNRLKGIIEDYFIFFKPRDIVSGDFYWFSQRDGKYYLAVVDCTGHGVPGALLSMIGNMKLNAIIEEIANPDPARMLLELHHGVRHALKQESGDSESNDGMDVAMCMIDLTQDTFTFAGARRALFYVQDAQLMEIKGSRDSVGGNSTEKTPVFNNQTIPIKTDTILYISSDGFADQNNPKNKKYGTTRFKQFLLAISTQAMAQQKQALEEELAKYQGNEEQRDDITVIGLKLREKRSTII